MFAAGFRPAFAAALFGLAVAGLAAAARANPRDYEFQLVDPEVKWGGGTIITVRLVHTPTGKTVPDAVVFATRINMAPDGMKDMTAPLDPLPDSLPGLYRFETDLLMPGRWALSLMAMVPGEVGVVQSRLIVKAVP